jgi:DNA (cytosine-5)-methyltransferase 1
MTLSVGSVCSGIGAPECAWLDLGWRFAWQAEIEDAPSAILRFHMPNVPNLGDMTTIADRVRAGEIEAPDVLVGGTPCQSFSVAGLRGGIGDARGNLALSFVDLANAIDAVRRDAGRPPCWVLWENVPGVFSDDENAFGAIMGGLVGSPRAVPARSDGGWDSAGVVNGPDRCAAWRVLDAKHFGVAQRRRRVFVLARGGAVRWSCANALLPLVQGVRWHPAPRKTSEEDAAHALAAGAGAGSGSARYDPFSEDYIAHTLRGEGFDASEDGTGRGTPIVPVIANPLGAKKDGGWRGDLDNDTFIPIAYADRGMSDFGEGIGTVRAKGGDAGGGSETLIAFNSREDPSVTGNCAGSLGASHPQAQAIAFQSSQSGVRIGDTHATLDANNGSRRHNGIVDGYAVRRLMPIECERLQGFPDGWTEVPRPGGNAVLADGHRYKALGNSMAVPVLRYIGERIAAQVAA